MARQYPTFPKLPVEQLPDNEVPDGTWVPHSDIWRGFNEEGNDIDFKIESDD